ncbi:hypothetical protein E2C01_062442 [Portunus trituberculatus]|uniref:Uncharacterized protein n=1 Tax=Portunus trituberculatus TaxID=210409 RepID=A0A5B7HI17_PORTR|nr:hypothetical protein [Portunus trituberculatus]
MKYQYPVAGSLTPIIIIISTTASTTTSTTTTTTIYHSTTGQRHPQSSPFICLSFLRPLSKTIFSL